LQFNAFPLYSISGRGIAYDVLQRYAQKSHIDNKNDGFAGMYLLSNLAILGIYARFQGVDPFMTKITAIPNLSPVPSK